VAAALVALYDGRMVARPKRNLSGTVTVGGDVYEWRLHSEPLWCTADGWRGLSLMVRHHDGQREAILQFPMSAPQMNRSQQPNRPKVTPALVEQAITDALAAGWEPLSRGKPVLVELD
jgi:hypothetical protein